MFVPSSFTKHTFNPAPCFIVRNDNNKVTKTVLSQWLACSSFQCSGKLPPELQLSHSCVLWVVPIIRVEFDVMCDFCRLLCRGAEPLRASSPAADVWDPGGLWAGSKLLLHPAGCRESHEEGQSLCFNTCDTRDSLWEKWEKANVSFSYIVVFSHSEADSVRWVRWLPEGGLEWKVKRVEGWQMTHLKAFHSAALHIRSAGDSLRAASGPRLRTSAAPGRDLPYHYLRRADGTERTQTKVNSLSCPSSFFSLHKHRFLITLLSYLHNRCKSDAQGDSSI